MDLTIRYYDQANNRQVEINVPADVVEISIPAQPDERLPRLNVNVNTDAVIIDRASDGKRIAMYEYTDLYAEAVTEIGKPGPRHAGPPLIATVRFDKPDKIVLEGKEYDLGPVVRRWDNLLGRTFHTPTQSYQIIDINRIDADSTSVRVQPF